MRDHTNKPEILRRIDPTALEQVPVPSEKEIRDAQERGRRDLEEMMTAPKAARINPKLRFR